jgi:hypothetical protein
MTVFAKKRMNVADWATVQDQIGQLQLAMGAPHDLMMFSAESDDPMQQDIYIGLPSATMLSAFPGFTQVDRASLPDFLATLVVREDEFEQLFPDIAKKRRARRG